VADVPGSGDVQRSGVFWIATNPEQTSEGNLQLRRGASSELVVNPDFYPAMEVTTSRLAGGVTKRSFRFADDPGPQTLYGLLSSEESDDAVPVSIFQAHSTNWSGSTQTFRPIWSVVGGHVEPKHPYVGVRLQIHRYPFLAQPPAQLATGGAARINTSEEWIELVDLPPRSYREFERAVIAPICTLLTLATGQRIRPSGVQVSPHADTWWSIYTEAQVDENPAFPYALIRPADITAPILARWLDRANVLGSLPAGVASVSEGSLAVETQVLILTTIAEGLHRALHPDRVRFTPEHGKVVQNTATAAVHEIDPAAAKAVNGFLNHVHELGYGTRLQQLATRAEQLVPGITGQSNRWKNLVYDARNEYAHKPSTEWMSEADIDRAVTVAESLRWVLRLLLLDQAGLDSRLLATSFRDSQRYRFFLRDAADWQPTIYADTPDSA